jgi:voltage-gated potassium channel
MQTTTNDGPTSPYSAARERTHELLEPAAPGDGASRAVDIFIVVLIGLNIVALILESVATLQAAYGFWFRTFEVASVAVFTVEYVARIWSGTARPGNGHWLRGRVRTATRPMVVIDALAILPFFLPMVGVDLRFLRALRMLRIFRILKIGRYSRAAQVIVRVLMRKKEELVVTLSVVALLLVLGSSLLYLLENEAQPEAFSSIPAAMWWGIATLSTVGYGDIYPMTGLGRMVGAIVAVLGIGMFALPAGILGGAFLQELESEPESDGVCRHCGHAVARSVNSVTEAGE